MTNKGLLIIISIILLGVLGVLLLNMTHNSAAQRAHSHLSEVANPVGNKIAD